MKTRRSYRRTEFYKNKKAIPLPRSETEKILELERQIGELINEDYDGARNTYEAFITTDKIIAALELAARFQHFSVKEFDWYFMTEPSKDILEIMEALIPDVEEYLNNNNIVRFGFCHVIDGNPIKEELVNLYIDNIDTYKKVVKFTRDVFVIDVSEYIAAKVTPESDSE